MAALDNLSNNTAAVQDLMRRVRQLETGTPMNSAAIGAGGIRVHSGGVINIENGGLVVNGSATIVGTMNMDGTFRMTGVYIATGPSTFNGPTDVKGDFTVTGPTKLDGKTDIGGNTTVDGTLDIKGKATLQNDLEVKNGGKVKAGNVTIDPSAYSGSVTFNNGARLAATSNGAQLQHGTGGGAVVVTANQTDVMVSGASNALIVNRGGTYLTGLPQTSQKPNLYVDGSGQIFRSTAA